MIGPLSLKKATCENGKDALCLTESPIISCFPEKNEKIARLAKQDCPVLRKYVIPRKMRSEMLAFFEFGSL
jgi:hypothetical protein